MSEAPPREVCDLCDGSDWELLAESGPHSCRILLCRCCSLMQASPRLEPDAMDAFYDEVFDRDHGSRVKAGGGLPDPARLADEERFALDWALPILKRHTELEGRRVLELRCRSGALTAAIAAEGADVVAIEPFEANVNCAVKVRGLDGVHILPFSRFHELPLDELEIDPGAGFEVVNLLSHHVLAHVLSPRRLLARIFEVLAPGGLLVLVEKDVLLPCRYKTPSALETGRAHQYHLTRATTERYLRAAGFEVIECEIDHQRATHFRHIRAVARKPASGSAPPPDGEMPVDEVRARLRTLERRWWVCSLIQGARHRLSKLLRRWRIPQGGRLGSRPPRSEA